MNLTIWIWNLVTKFGLLFVFNWNMSVDGQSSLVNYNLMSCMDFARHISGTVPSRFGMFGRRRSVRSISVQSAISSQSNQRLTRQFGLSDTAIGSSTMMAGLFRDLLFQVLNVGDRNTNVCKERERFESCSMIDGYLEDNFPQWFFDYKVTDNVNHLISQVSSNRYHALFESGIKAYRCFCQC